MICDHELQTMTLIVEIDSQIHCRSSVKFIGQRSFLYLVSGVTDKRTRQLADSPIALRVLSLAENWLNLPLHSSPDFVYN